MTGRAYPPRGADFQPGGGAPRMTPMRGRFWVFEGMDGSGKSTQAERLVAWLRGRGGDPLHVREPGTTALGERLRALLLDPERPQAGARAEALLFFAARVELLREQVAPALADGRDVVCDRFTPSTLAYQGQEAGESELILELDRLLVPEGLQPDAVFVLDLEPAEAYARVTAGALDGFEQRGVDFQEQVRAGYLRYLEARPETAVRLDGARDVEAVAAEVRAEVERRSA